MVDLIITTPASHLDKIINFNSMLHRHLTYRWRPSHLCHKSNNIKPIRTTCRPYSSHPTLGLTLSQQPTAQIQLPPAHQYLIQVGQEHHKQHGNPHHLSHPHNQQPVQKHRHSAHLRSRLNMDSHLRIHMFHPHQCRLHLLRSRVILSPARSLERPMLLYHPKSSTHLKRRKEGRYEKTACNNNINEAVRNGTISFDVLCFKLGWKIF